MAPSSPQRKSAQGGIPFPGRRPSAHLPLDLEDSLDAGFYDRPTIEVAQALLGTILARRDSRGRIRAGIILETEAYVAGDPANHAFLGVQRRNWTMFAGPGHLYVYRIHRVHCANVTTAPGEAVLIRSAIPLGHSDGRMSGPGLVCRALGVSWRDDGTNLLTGPIRILPGTGPIPTFRVTERIGIRLGAELPFRYIIPPEAVPPPWGPGTPCRTERG